MSTIPLETPRSHDVEQLAEHRGPCLSLALATPWRGPEARSAATALQGLLRDAEKEAAERGFDPTMTAGLLGPAQQFAEDPELPRGLGEGLAVYVAPEVA